MTEVGNIVTLEDNLEYLILEETEKNNVKYYYAVRVLIDETPTDEYLIFELITDEDGEYLKVVEDKKLYDELLDDFKDIVFDKLGDLDEALTATLPDNMKDVFNVDLDEGSIE